MCHNLMIDTSWLQLMQACSSEPVFVTTNDLSEMLIQVNSVETPTIFDLGGGEVRWSGSLDEELIFTANGVTIQNGTIWLAGSATRYGSILSITSKRLTMKNISITGGQRGLHLQGGCSVILQDCTMTNQKSCLVVGNRETSEPPAVLVAVGLKLSAFVYSGMIIVGGHVNLTGCDIRNSTGTAVYIEAHSLLESTNMLCVNNQEGGVSCNDQGNALLVDCIFQENARFDVHKTGREGCMELTACELNKAPSTRDGGKVIYQPKVSYLKTLVLAHLRKNSLH